MDQKFNFGGHIGYGDSYLDLLFSVFKVSNEMQLQNLSSAFIHKNKSLLSATSLLSRSLMAYNTTATLDKLSCTNYVDFGKCQGRFGRISWSKK